MKKQITESPIKRYARRMLREGEIESAECALAAKDQVDSLADIIDNVSKMENDQLPKLIEKIRGTYGPEQATAYQQTADAVFSELLGIVKEKKSTLEQALLVLTGEAQAEQNQTELNLPDEEAVGDEELGNEFKPSNKTPSPLGREARIPADESRQFNKKLSEAKIVALKKALDETDTKKFPIRARRISEELTRVVTEAIKEESKKVKAKKLNNVKKSGKDMLKKVEKPIKKK
jgi:hypothetical protein